MEPSNAAKPRARFLLIGADEEIRSLVRQLGSDLQFEERDYTSKATLGTEDNPVPPIAILFGPPPEQIPVLEIAGSIAKDFKDIPIYLAGSIQEGFNKEILLQSGFTDVFLLPFDRQALKERLGCRLESLGLPPRVFTPVQLNDIEAGTTLDFDLYVYLSANSKYLKYAPAGDALDQERIERLKTKHVRSVFTPASQADLFRSYSARRLSRLVQGKADPEGQLKMSETERREKMRAEVRGFIADLFSPHNASLMTGRMASDDCRGIIQAYVTNSDYKSQLDRLRELLGNQANPYSHASNTSMLASLLAMATGAGRPEDLAIAGLLHDLGEAKVSSVILEMPREKWSKEDRALYQKHPQYAIDVLQANRMILPEAVHKYILQHHERFDGSGYPKGISGVALSRECQVLALADEIEERTSYRPGSPREEPIAVLDSIKKLSELNPPQRHYDPILLGEITLLFREALGEASGEPSSSTPGNPPAQSPSSVSGPPTGSSGAAA